MRQTLGSDGSRYTKAVKIASPSRNRPIKVGADTVMEERF